MSPPSISQLVPIIETSERIVDIGYEKMAAFMEDRKKAYLSAAKLLGLAK